MENDMDVQDLQKAIAALLICLGTTLPPALVAEVRHRAHGLAERMDNGGEPKVGTLTKGLADALAGIPLPEMLH